jgi:hypothetical protein
MTFTPPTDMSVMVQSRGKEPVPNWIFAKLLHRRRSLLRRFANMSIPGPTPVSILVLLALQPLLNKNYWNLPSRTSRIISILFDFSLPRYPDISNGREQESR